jgi:predicted AAA+ superfamily ATPase
MQPAAYLPRDIDAHLLAWKTSARRKPLLLRGARQVGKSTSVRYLGRTFEHFVEVNFDEKKGVRDLFNRDLSPQQICSELALLYATPIVSGKTLLFFDEIQSCLPAISSLRYFYERYPELHLAAAGSLLEFALEEIPSFGVGRIHSLHQYPLSFREYLLAAGEAVLPEAIAAASPDEPLSAPIHQKCVRHLLDFLRTGGMPEAVAAFIGNASLLDCQTVLDDLLASFFDDFAKYKSRVPASRLREAFGALMRQSGGKFVFSNAIPDTSSAQIKEAVSLLERAGLVYPVFHTAGNGLPMAAEQNEKSRKYAVLDTGLMQRFLGLDLSGFATATEITQINRGALAEIWAGLELVKAQRPSGPAHLFYWHREQRGSQAEVDYLVQCGEAIVPVEVRAGTSGSMQSLRRFMGEKASPRGIRCSLENFGRVGGIDIIPLYAIANICRPNDMA